MAIAVDENIVRLQVPVDVPQFVDGVNSPKNGNNNRYMMLSAM
jgi:hypothetical protein